ncbi:hypothetical protein N9W88_03665 [Alphaproteobacteria bacterium]|jgi:Flp pilus assembly protein TadB|nr:hypothetical protein [Alphaproteobacteria bacterium]
MTLREFGYSLESWGVSLLEWFIDYLRVFFLQTSWLDASLFMLFWVVVGYLVILGVGFQWLEREYAKNKAEHEKKYKEDEEYRKEYDAHREEQIQHQLRKMEEEDEFLKNASWREREPFAFWGLVVMFLTMVLGTIYGSLIPLD